MPDQSNTTLKLAEKIVNTYWDVLPARELVKAVAEALNEAWRQGETADCAARFSLHHHHDMPDVRGRGNLAMTETTDRSFMGTRSDAEARFLAAVDKWNESRQPLMATAKEHRQRDILEHETRFQLANAASLLAWHMRHPIDGWMRPNEL